MTFIYSRTVRFQDTDAAGVVYFANVLAMCHEAYEASLAATGINLNTFFQGGNLAIPIVHANVDFFKPMYCGDRLHICLTAHSPQPTEFQIQYQITAVESPKQLAQAMTRHVCIQTATRSRCPFPTFIQDWLQHYADELAAVPSPVDD